MKTANKKGVSTPPRRKKERTAPAAGAGVNTPASSSPCRETKLRVLHLLEDIRALVRTDALDRASGLIAEIMTCWPHEYGDDEEDVAAVTVHDEKETVVLPQSWTTSPASTSYVGFLTLPLDLYALVCTFLFVHEHKCLSASRAGLYRRDASPHVWRSVWFDYPRLPEGFHLMEAPQYVSMDGLLCGRRLCPPVTLRGVRNLRISLVDESQLEDDETVLDVSCLRECHSLRTLDLALPIASLEPLQGCRVLESLEVEVDGMDVDVSPLSNLTALQQLYLSNTQVAHVSPLSNLTALQQLWLYNTRVADVSALATLTALQELELNNTEVADVSPLSTLTALQELYLNNTQVADVSPLSTLTTLQRLYLRNTEVADVLPLSTLTALQQLWLNGTEVADVSPLSTLTTLQQLYLESTQVADVSSLSTLTALQQLHLSGTQVADVLPLSTLTALQRLWLNDTEVADVSPLSTLTALQLLHLNDTEVVDVSPLSTLTTLQQLYLRNTQVADVSPLSQLNNLMIWGP